MIDRMFIPVFVAVTLGCVLSAIPLAIHYDTPEFLFLLAPIAVYL